MKVLFAVSNEAVSESIIKKYQQMYKEIIASKNVYYFNAIIKELQKDKTYDRIVISEDLEPFTNNNYETIDNFIFEKLDNISDEASTTTGEDIPIILIATDRRTRNDNLLIKLFGIGVYSALLEQDRSIDEVCKLIHKPRSKKEAKIYYKIDSNEVEYKPENEGDVSETEIQNILTHYKRLGRNEERYVESFDNIAAQYTDEQLRVIIKFLPLNVKAVLEENSTRYQQLMSFGNPKVKKQNNDMMNHTKKNNDINKAIHNTGIKIESISNGETKLTKPVIIPSMKTIKREKVANPTTNVAQTVEEQDPQIEEIVTKQPEVITPEVLEPVKRGRGRPKKVQVEATNVEPTEKKKRGRPRKNIPQEENLPEVENLEQEENMLPGFEDIDSEIENNTTLPGWEEETVENEEDNIMPGFETLEEENQQDFAELETTRLQPATEEFNTYDNVETTELENYKKENAKLESLLSQDKKIVAFVGTSKNGTSFLINNLAEMIAKQGIKTAILDLTQNRNAYYIYTKNEEELRKTAFSCRENLTRGIANGIKVNHHLDVYTSLPGENTSVEEYNSILETLVRNYSLILLDCDFKSPYEYLKAAQEIYLVQSMDVLTIQPLTAYLRELKAKGILAQNKLRVVINKYIRVKGVTEKTMIGGMAFYNDPAMSFMTELFNRETVPYCTIPFDGQVYAKYLEGLINCNISLNGYPKEIMNALRKLANMVYPLIGANSSNNKIKYENPKYNQYTTNTFSNNMNSTLDKMKRNY